MEPAAPQLLTPHCKSLMDTGTALTSSTQHQAHDVSICSWHLDCTPQQHLADKQECTTHKYMADQDSLNIWLTRQLQNAASAAAEQGISRDQDMPQAGDAAAKQGGSLKLHRNDKKTRVGEHELGLLTAQYHFNWKLAEAKYEALGAKYETLVQLCRQQQLELDSQICQSCCLGCCGWKSMEDSLVVSASSLQLCKPGNPKPEGLHLVHIDIFAVFQVVG